MQRLLEAGRRLFARTAPTARKAEPGQSAPGVPDFTFKVSDVKPNRTPIRYRKPLREALADLLGEVESCSDPEAPVLWPSSRPALVDAAHHSFCGHYPLVLSPDMIWATVLQRLGTHVSKNSEKLRSRLVRHEGKARICVQRDDFQKGRADNPWPEVFGFFSERIREFLADGVHALLVPSFSTTGDIERAAFEVALMDVTQAYFEFDMMTLCGIPSVTLEGTPADWEDLKGRVDQLGRFGLKRWTHELAPILKQFVAASQGQVDRDFRQSLYKFQSRSGGDLVSGWILSFLPSRGLSYAQAPFTGRSWGSPTTWSSWQDRWRSRRTTGRWQSDLAWRGRCARSRHLRSGSGASGGSPIPPDLLIRSFPDTSSRQTF